MELLEERYKKILHDRVHAAYILAEKLHQYKGNENTLIVAIPNGGVPVGYYLSSILELPLQLIPCKKMLHPSDTSKTIGSVCLDELILHADRDIPQDYVQHQTIIIRSALQVRDKLFTGDQEKISLAHKTVILVDDRLKTDDTIQACLKSIQRQHPKQIIIAAPIVAAEVAHRLQADGNELVCLIMPESKLSSEHFFDDFKRVTDEEVIEFAHKAQLDNAHRKMKAIALAKHKPSGPHAG